MSEFGESSEDHPPRAAETPATRARLAGAEHDLRLLSVLPDG